MGWAARLGVALVVVGIASWIGPRLAARLPTPSPRLPLLPLYERVLWLLRHPVHRLVHTLSFLLVCALRPVLPRRTAASVCAQAVGLTGSGAGPADSFHLEALEHQLPDFAGWLPYGPIYPFQKQVANKIRLEAWHNARPELACVDLKLPLWVVGLPRTGSTIFHKLMSFDRRARTVRAWELRHPVPPAKPENWEADKRYADFNSGSKAAYVLHPAMKDIHHVMAGDPDECIWGMVDCAEPLHLWGALDQPSSYRWYLERKGGLPEMYINYRRLLQVLCSTDGHPVDSHLVLKSPHHTVHMPSIVEAFGPSQVFIWLHRHPNDVVASCCSMNLNFREYMSSDFEQPAILGRRTLQRLGECMRKALKDREALARAGHRFIDIHYKDFVSDSIGVIRGLYNELGLAFEEDFAEKIEAKLAADAAKRRSDGRSGHKYCLDDFGLSDRDVRVEFASYLRLHFGET